ncbi:holo-ACP synthase [Sulfurimonas marina]|uniref:Holo-[acyl-carrier-protein] synthase n=1 Tax=Sulfurimonas marina TaxID=2590551 RepID=A0A7M1AVX9_9BACT|nr:holo-ACP synthase [Sulfurimonas marina]QOP41621.1 holo-ACP synthase [Sulfurimonas marina]
MIGIDLINTSRMQQMIEKFGDKALSRFLSDDEKALVKNYKTAAGFWATKEAVSKALGTGIGAECSFFDIKIYKDEKGAPKLSLSKKLVEQFKIVDAALSITHDGEYAIAAVSIKVSTTTDKIKQF